MAQTTGLITNSSLGIVARSCTPQQMSDNLQSIGDALTNLQNQIGDPNTIKQILAGENIPITGAPGLPGSDGPTTPSGTNLTQLLSDIIRVLGPLFADSFKVMVNSADTPAYLEPQMTDWQASPLYSSSQDLLIKVDTTTIASDPQLRYYGDMSAVSGWSAVGKQALITDTGTLKFIAKTTLTPSALTPSSLTPSTITPSSTTVVTDVSWDTGTCVMTKTTGTIYTLPNSSAFYVFPSSSIVYVFPNGSAVYVFPNSNAVNYFQG